MCEFDGSTWTNIPQTFPSGPRTGNFSTTGIQTACLSVGGGPGTPQTVSSEWDGSAWTTTNALVTGNNSAVHKGTVSSSVLLGGPPPSGGYGSGIQTWDGTNWSTSPLTLTNGRSQAAGAGTATSAYIASGTGPGGSYTNSTEEFDAAAVETKTLTTS